MSFILEALKKSEQQRQLKNTSPQKVRKRTLSLSSRRSNHRSYWMVAGSLSLVLLVGWWFYGKTPTQGRPPLANQQTSVPPVLNHLEAVEPATKNPSMTSVQKQPVATGEPAPVPRDVFASQTVSLIKASRQSYKPAAKPRRTDATTAKRKMKADEQIASVVIEQPEPQNIDAMSLKPKVEQLPRYLGLSRELRDMMPRLAMSMHFFTSTPSRRLVRINNHLLHEGDWLGSDLQVVEITAKGATLDFLGKLFVMRSPGR